MIWPENLALSSQIISKDLIWLSAIIPLSLLAVAALSEGTLYCVPKTSRILSTALLAPKVAKRSTMVPLTSAPTKNEPSVLTSGVPDLEQDVDECWTRV
jgi:hypothetical protein